MSNLNYLLAPRERQLRHRQRYTQYHLVRTNGNSHSQQVGDDSATPSPQFFLTIANTDQSASTQSGDENRLLEFGGSSGQQRGVVHSGTSTSIPHPFARTPSFERSYTRPTLKRGHAGPQTSSRSLKRLRRQPTVDHDIATQRAEAESASRRSNTVLHGHLNHRATVHELMHQTPNDTEPVIVSPGSLQAISMERAVENSPGRRFIVSSHYDEDAWPVNDVRRTFDVLTSMQKLHPPSRRVLSEWQRHVPDIPRSRPGLELDIQGLRWDVLNITRKDFIRARRLHHPSKNAAVRYKRPFDLSRPEMCAEDRYVFRNYTPAHRAMFSHFQLRNVLATNGRNEIFYAADGKISRTALSCPNSHDTILDVSKSLEFGRKFQITCLGASPQYQLPGHSISNVVLAGGFNGEFILLTSSKDPVQGILTNANNGLVTHIHTFNDRRSGLLQATFCSNEGKLRLMDVHTFQFTHNFSYNHPINCSATSVDGRLRAVVGDMNETLITDAEKGEVLATLQAHDDYAFACAWSHDGRYIATGAQDNTVLVWDARNWSKPLTVQSTSVSCARSVHFTLSGDLVVAESEDVVSIYNKGTFDVKQDLRFFGSIAGVALVNGGEEIVVANCDRTVGGLLSFELRDSGRGNFSRHRRTQPRRVDWVCDFAELHI